MNTSEQAKQTSKAVSPDSSNPALQVKAPKLPVKTEFSLEENKVNTFTVKKETEP